MCNAITSNGTQCSKNAKYGDYCYAHKNLNENDQLPSFKNCNSPWINDIRSFLAEHNMESSLDTIMRAYILANLVNDGYINR